MGFATSITVAIFFIAAMIMATMAYPVIYHSYTDISDSISEKHRLQINELNTRINLVSISPDGGNILLTVSNNGSTVLHTNRCNLLVDGIYTEYTVSPSGLWLPGENVVFTVTGTSDQRIKIILENGISVYYPGE